MLAHLCLDCSVTDQPPCQRALHCCAQHQVARGCACVCLQGRMGAALRYLEMVPGEASTSVAVLKDRIYR